MPSTKFSKLIPQRNSDGDMIIPLRDENIDPPAEETPIPAKGTQVLWCDHKRVTDTDANLVDGNIPISATFGWNHTPECGYGFRTRLRTRTQVRVRKRYGVRVKVEFVVRKWYGVREVFENGVRVRVRVKSGQKSWCV